MNLKTIYVLAATFCCSSAILTGCETTQTAGTKAVTTTDAAIVGSSATLVVHGMSCPLCANNVDKQLLAVPGVESVNVDMGTGEVTVKLAPDARVTTSQLATAVDNSGFTLAEVRHQ